MSNNPTLIYNLFPLLAGKFPQWKNHIERAAQMKFTHLYVNPVLYPGFSGSLYSIKDYERINPFFLDDSSKDDEWVQFQEIIYYTQKQGLKFVFDLVLNHTAFDSPWVKSHKAWYKKDKKGAVLKPFCMDNGKKIIWGDLAELDLEESKDKTALWKYWTDYVAKLVDMGVDGFRCDAAYQVPADFWAKIISNAKKVNPDVEFFAETLGCAYEEIKKLTAAGFDFSFNSSKYWDFKEKWALTQNSQNVGITQSISFAESHDTERLATEYNGNIAAIKQRYLFSVAFSSGVMMPIGLEFAFRKRVNVVNSRPEDWEETGIDLRTFIRRCNDLKYNFPIFCEDSPIEKQDSVEGILAILKTSNDQSQRALILINSNLEEYRDFFNEDLQSLFSHPAPIRDVSIEYFMEQIPNKYHYNLRPGQVIILLQDRGKI